MHRYALRSGERQTALTFDSIRADHRARYRWAGDRAMGRGLDLFCGVGYGTHWLAECGCAMVGVDGSPDAIACAIKRYPHARASFECREWPGVLPFGFDFVTCFESLEHVDDDVGLLRALHAALNPGGLLLLSVPNEAVVPHAAMANPFHARHYTRVVLATLLLATGFVSPEWYGQHSGDDAALTMIEREAERATLLVAAYAGALQ